MSDTAREGPPIAETVVEVQGLFSSRAALEEAVHRLRTSGFDQADLSLPQPAPAPEQATPESAAAPLLTETDTRQARTLATSTAGSVGAFAGAAAVVTGGVAVGVAAAVAAAAGAAGLANLAGTAAAASQDRALDEAAQRGHLVLTVRTPTAERVSRAEAVLHEAGAIKLAAVSRRDAGIDAARWTG